MKLDGIKICEYEGCNLFVNEPHDTKLCVFHAPKENKGITVVKFNEKIFKEKNDNNDFNFAGYVFPGEINFTKYNYRDFKYANFTRTKFLGNVNFSETQFSGDANFEKAQFSGNANFRGAKFSWSANFEEAQFSGNNNFWKVQFSENVYFSGAKFSEIATFWRAQFSEDAFFNDTHFLGDADFREAQFSKGVYFINNIIQMKMTFENISFLKESHFYFRNPNSNSKENEVFVNFEGITFLPFKTYFENIEFKKFKKGFIEQDKYEPNVCFLFRYCQLEDVYFTGNDMSLFSFYKSNFDQARFVSCDWREERGSFLKIPYKRRKNILFEDFLFSNIPQDEKEKINFCKKYQIEDLTLREIGSLYRRMKTALDRTKDYQESGRFYFNEFETKRRELKKISPWKLIYYKNFIYYIYIVFAGYGEKPFRSFFWIVLSLIFFSFIHLFSGLNTSKGQINYDISLRWEAIRNIFSREFLGVWLDSWFDSFIFTIYRLIPVNYMPSTENTITPVGLHGLFFALLNTLILILMITFFVIGIKRQFRRF